MPAAVCVEIVTMRSAGVVKIITRMKKNSLLWLLLLPLSLFCQEKVAAGGYGDMLYPYVHEYDQMLTYKIVVDYFPSNPMPSRTATEVEEIISRIDYLTRGNPKLD